MRINENVACSGYARTRPLSFEVFAIFSIFLVTDWSSNHQPCVPIGICNWKLLRKGPDSRRDPLSSREGRSTLSPTSPVKHDKPFNTSISPNSSLFFGHFLALTSYTFTNPCKQASLSLNPSIPLQWPSPPQAQTYVPDISKHNPQSHLQYY